VYTHYVMVGNVSVIQTYYESW